MLNIVKIVNFQAHKRSILEFHKGVNVIVGQSDKGKTSIIRAIRWAIMNKPTGDAIRSNWGGDTEVIVTTEQGVVTRKKTDTKNIYMVDADLLKAFGQGVPKEVSDVFNMDDVNIQLQMDAPFLISKTSGEVATFFNKVANIDVIDRATANAKKEISQINQSINYSEKDLTQKQEQYKTYDNLPIIEQKLKEIDVLDGNRKKLNTGKSDIKTSLQRCEEISVELKEIEELVNDAPVVSSLLKKHDQSTEKKLQVRKVQQLISTEAKLSGEIEEIEELLSLQPLVVKLTDKTTKRAAIQANLATLNTLVRKCTNLSQTIAKTQENVQELEEQIPEVCFVCGGTGKLKNHKH